MNWGDKFRKLVFLKRELKDKSTESKITRFGSRFVEKSKSELSRNFRMQRERNANWVEIFEWNRWKQSQREVRLVRKVTSRWIRNSLSILLICYDLSSLIWVYRWTSARWSSHRGTNLKFVRTESGCLLVAARSLPLFEDGDRIPFSLILIYSPYMSVWGGREIKTLESMNRLLRWLTNEHDKTMVDLMEKERSILPLLMNLVILVFLCSFVSHLSSLFWQKLQRYSWTFSLQRAHFTFDYVMNSALRKTPALVWQETDCEIRD